MTTHRLYNRHFLIERVEYNKIECTDCITGINASKHIKWKTLNNIQNIENRKYILHTIAVEVQKYTITTITPEAKV